MKKHLSIFGLFARSSIYKIIGILSLLSIVESSLFALHFTKDILSKESIRRFELYISYGKLNICLAISFVLITF